MTQGHSLDSDELAEFYLSSSQVVEFAGMTYRQLDTWSTKGFLKPLGGEHSGDHRRWPLPEVFAAVRMGILVRWGMRPEAAARMVRGDSEQAFDIVAE